jgi:membrane protein involved in colicin uptake
MERAAAERKRKEAEAEAERLRKEAAAEAERLRKEEEEKMINRCFYKECARTHTLPHTTPPHTL